MFIAIDIGNTNIAIGLYQHKKGKLLQSWRIGKSQFFFYSIDF